MIEKHAKNNVRWYVITRQFCNSRLESESRLTWIAQIICTNFNWSSILVPLMRLWVVIIYFKCYVHTHDLVFASGIVQIFFIYSN